MRVGEIAHLIRSISRPDSGLRSSSWALWARDRQYVGRNNIKTIPYASVYRGIYVTDVTFEFECLSILRVMCNF